MADNMQSRSDEQRAIDETVRRLPAVQRAAASGMQVLADYYAKKTKELDAAEAQREAENMPKDDDTAEVRALKESALESMRRARDVMME
jgi:hypothetical protein